MTLLFIKKMDPDKTNHRTYFVTFASFMIVLVTCLAYASQSPNNSIFAFLRYNFSLHQNISHTAGGSDSQPRSGCGIVSSPKESLKMQYKKALYAKKLLVNKGRSRKRSNNSSKRFISILRCQNFISHLRTFLDEENERDKEHLQELENIAQKRIHSLQTSVNCETERKLICFLRVKCGVGCLLHHMGICLFTALGTNRSMIIDYPKRTFGGIDKVFAPAARPCLQANLSDAVEWKGEELKNSTPYDVPLVKISIRGAFDPKTSFAPFSVPIGIIGKLQRFHEEPDVWWTGQVMKFLSRVQPEISRSINFVKELVGFTHPIVGVHIRRSDKKSEARLYDLELYMTPAMSWYDQYDARRGIRSVRRIYLATDDPYMHTSATRSYPNYTFLSEPDMYKHTLLWRYTHDGLSKAMVDVKLLSQCDYFIGTLSSNMGRLVYELMQADGDRTFDVFSLDKGIYYIGGHKQVYMATDNHTPLSPGEVELRIGDRVEVNFRKFGSDVGFGLNVRLWRSGSFPKYKVKRFLRGVEYPGIP